MFQANVWLLSVLQVIGLLDVFSPATCLAGFDDVWVFASFLEGGVT